jgi:hypothetical protein
MKHIRLKIAREKTDFYYFKRIKLGNGKQFKIIFVITHQIADQILQIDECNQIAIHLYLFAMNLNTDKPKNI